MSIWGNPVWLRKSAGGGRLYLIQDGKVNTSDWTVNLIAFGSSAGGGETTVDNVDYYRIYNADATTSRNRTNCYFTPKQSFPVDYAYLIINARSRGYDDRPFGLMSNYGASGSDPTYFKRVNMKDGNTTVLSDLTEFSVSLSDVTSGEYWFGFSTKEVSFGGIRTGEVLVRDFYLTNEVPN